MVDNSRALRLAVANLLRFATATGTEPAEWIRQPIPEAPFNGTTPVAYIAKRGLVGARDILRKIMAMGLRLGPL